MSEKNLIFGILYDYYCDLLKNNQAIIIDLYYNQDFSLSEISEELNITRAGIHDTLKRAEKKLSDYENKLCLYKKYKERQNIVNNIVDKLKKIDDDKYKKEIEYIREEAEKILNEG